MNVQGLITKYHNKLDSNELVNIFENNDIIGLTETWSGNEYNYDVNGFTAFALHRNTNRRGAKRKSGGIILYLRNKLVTKDNVVIEHTDSHLWVKIDKTVNGLNKNLFICLCYIIPSNSSRQIQVENNVYDLMLNDIISIKDTYGEEHCLFMIMGDTNSRTGILPDYVSC